MCCIYCSHGSPSELALPANIEDDKLMEEGAAPRNLRGTLGVVDDKNKNEQNRRNLQYAQATPTAQQYDPNNPAHVAYAQQQYAQQYAAAAAAQQAQQYAAAGYMQYQPQMLPQVASTFGQQMMQPGYMGQAQQGYAMPVQVMKTTQAQDAKKQYDKIKEMMLATEFGTGDRKIWCYVMKEKYSIIPGQSFGNLPQNMHKQFMHARCDRYFCKPHPMSGKGRFVCEPLDDPASKPVTANVTASAVPAVATPIAGAPPPAPVVKT